MSRSTFRVLFYLKRNAPKKNGLVSYELYSLIAHELDKPPYCLPMLWQSLHLQATNKNFGLVFF